MARVVAELVVDGQQVFVRQMEEAEDAAEQVGEGSRRGAQGVSSLTSAMTALGGALATRELVQWGTDAANYARDLGAMQAKAETVLGDHVDEIRAFSTEHASRFGLARDELTGLAAGYADLLVPMGFTRAEAGRMTEQTLLLAGALGEWSPQLGGAQHALEALGAAMTGEREQLKAYGIVIDEAAVNTELAARQMDTLTGEALRQARAQVTLDLALRGSTDAQAQFAAGGDPAVVAAAESRAAYAEMRAEIGENLLPIMTTAHGLFADITGVVSAMPEPVQTAGVALVGLGAAAIPIAATVRAMNDLGISAATVRSRLGTVGSFMAGPWGLAIAGATVGLGLLWNAQQQANDRIAQANQLIDTNTGALLANAAQTRATQLQQDGIADTAARFGIELSTLTAASLGNEQAQRQMRASIDETIESMLAQRANLRPGTLEFDQHVVAIDRARNHARSLTDTIDDQASTLDAQVEAARAARDAADDLARSYDIEGVAVEQAASAHDSWNRTGDQQVTIAWTLQAAHHASLGAAIAHAEQQERLAEAFRDANARMDAQHERLRAAADPFFAATSAQQRLADAQDRLESAETTEERAAAQRDVAQAAVDLQGALVDLDVAQRDGESSARLFDQTLDSLVDQGLLARDAANELADAYGRVADEAQRANDAIRGATSTSTSTLGGPLIGTGGANPVSTTRDALPAPTARSANPVGIGGTSIGEVHLHGVDPSRPGEARRLVDDMYREIEWRTAEEAAAP